MLLLALISISAPHSQVLSMFKRGIVNVHPSLLPRCAGLFSHNSHTCTFVHKYICIHTHVNFYTHVYDNKHISYARIANTHIHTHTRPDTAAPPPSTTRCWRATHKQASASSSCRVTLLTRETSSNTSACPSLLWVFEEAFSSE